MTKIISAGMLFGPCGEKKLHSEMTKINLKPNEIMCSYMPGLPLLEM